MINVTDNTVAFSPSDYGITTCTKAYFGITSVGATKSESALSEEQMFTVL
jgi:hypothetical protein